MKLVIPNNDRQRQNFLTDAVSTGLEDQTQNRLLISGALLNQTGNLLTAFENGLDNLKETYQSRRGGVAHRTAAQDLLAGRARRFISSLNNWIDEEGLPVNILDLFRLPTDGSRPQPRNATQWILVVRDLIKGHEKAIDRGLTPAVYPTVDMLTTSLAGLEAEVTALNVARADLQNAQALMRSLRAEVTKLYRRMVLYLRHQTLDLAPATQRDAMRRYGIEFETTDRLAAENGAANEPGDTPPTGSTTDPTGSTADPRGEPTGDPPMQDPTSGDPTTDPGSNPAPTEDPVTSAEAVRFVPEPSL